MEGTFMKKINLRNPLAIYCLTLASLILTIGVIYVIVDVNSKLAPEKQILFSLRMMRKITNITTS